MTGGLMHQGLALQVPPFQYTELDELLARAARPRPTRRCWWRWTESPIRATSGCYSLGRCLRRPGRDLARAPRGRRDRGGLANLGRQRRPHPIAQVTNLTRSLKAGQQAGLFWSVWTLTPIPTCTNSATRPTR